MSDPYDENPQVKSVSFGTIAFVIDAVFIYRRDAYKKYKQELDALYALGEPQPEKTTKL